jgi:hypothetical protein
MSLITILLSSFLQDIARVAINRIKAKYFIERFFGKKGRKGLPFPTRFANLKLY